MCVLRERECVWVGEGLVSDLYDECVFELRLYLRERESTCGKLIVHERVCICVRAFVRARERERERERESERERERVCE